MNDVMLLNVSRYQTGIYKCEATEELPTLETEAQQAHMMVVGMYLFLMHKNIIEL